MAHEKSNLVQGGSNILEFEETGEDMSVNSMRSILKQAKCYTGTCQWQQPVHESASTQHNMKELGLWWVAKQLADGQVIKKHDSCKIHQKGYRLIWRECHWAWFCHISNDTARNLLTTHLLHHYCTLSVQWWATTLQDQALTFVKEAIKF